MRMKRVSVCILFLSMLVAIAGCGHAVPAQHFGVTLDDNGTRYRGEVDFESYMSNAAKCESDDNPPKPIQEGPCQGGLLAHGTVDDLTQIQSAGIDETIDGLEVYSIVVRGDDDNGNFLCTLQDRDITHAVQCVGTASGECSITLTPDS